MFTGLGGIGIGEPPMFTGLGGIGIGDPPIAIIGPEENPGPLKLITLRRTVTAANTTASASKTVNA